MDIDSRKWFSTINSVWQENSTETSKKRFPLINDRLNYNNLLLKQELKDYIVLYSGTGTNICSCVINRHVAENIDNNEIRFIPDVKTWIFQTNIKDEAYYLSAILNSKTINDLIKPLQPQGLGGARAIHRRPLQFPIQQFDENNTNHLTLAAISFQVHELIQSKTRSGLIKKRKQARELIKNDLANIDLIVKELLAVKIK